MKDNKTKVITIAALVIAVIALSIGFAAFSSTLNIQTGAQVNPTDTFSVKFSNSDTSLAVPNVLPTNNSTATGDTAVINNNDAHNPVISNLSAHFTAPGEKVEYVFYVRNMGPYDAYLTDIRFNNATGGSSFKKCTATSDNPVSNANAMCEYINFKLELAGLATPLTPSSNFASAVGNNYIVNKSATPESGNTNSKLVKVTIEYPDGSPYADGSFDVDFGSVEMVFASLAGYVPPVPTPVEPDYSSMFVSYEEGELSSYIGNDTEVVIPDGLRLPIITYTVDYNQTKCMSNYPIEYLDEGETVEDACASMSTMINQMSVADIFANELDVFCDITSTQSQSKYLITSIGDNAFRGKGLTSVSIGNDIVSIGDSAFSRNNLTTVTLGSSVRTFGDEAFKKGSNAISSLTIYASSEYFTPNTLGDNSFQYADGCQFSSGDVNSNPCIHFPNG